MKYSNFPKGTNVIHLWWTTIQKHRWLLLYQQCVCHYYIANASHKSLIFNCNPLQRSILNSIYRKCSDSYERHEPYIQQRVDLGLLWYSFENFHFKLHFIIYDLYYRYYVRHVCTNSYLNFSAYVFICRGVVLLDFSIVRLLDAIRFSRALIFPLQTLLTSRFYYFFGLQYSRHNFKFYRSALIFFKIPSIWAHCNLLSIQNVTARRKNYILKLWDLFDYTLTLGY